MNKITLILLSAVFMLCAVSCSDNGDLGSSSLARTPDTEAVNSYEGSLGKTIMGIRVVVQSPENEQTGVKTYLVFENEDDNCVLYSYHFYPDSTYFDSDLKYYQNQDAEITYDENALMIKVKGDSPYETLEGAYAAYYSANGFTII